MAIAATLQTPPKSRARTLTTTTIITTTIVKKRSIKAQERDILLSKAILGVQNGKYKTTQAVATALNLRLDTIQRHISSLSYLEHMQKLLSKNQEQTLLK
jgi:hypothetical protein